MHSKALSLAFSYFVILSAASTGLVINVNPQSRDDTEGNNMPTNFKLLPQQSHPQAMKDPLHVYILYSLSLNKTFGASR